MCLRVLQCSMTCTMNNLDLMKKRLDWQGGDQEHRMIQDKYKTFLKTLKYSHQAEDVRKMGEDVQWRALINPDKEKEDYDDKILSIDFASKFMPGDIFEWLNTDTKWIVYLPHSTEDSFFKAEIRRCKWQLFWVDGKEKKSSWCYIQGPVETKINYLQKSEISMDTPNWSLDILIPNNPDTKKFFKRYARFLFNDMAWEIQVVDSISIEGILQITALEYYKDADKDKPDEALADAFIIKPAREEKSGEHIIEGEGIIRPKKSYVYGAGLAGGAWSIKEKRPITLVPLADQRVKLVWNDVVSGNFTLVYTVEGATYEKMIVVESLF